jgi:predicted RNase H-like nuclease (RuvC/YqgF family)
MQKISTILMVITVALFSCEPSQTQLQKEKARTETTVKQNVEPIQKEMQQLKNEVKILQMQSDLKLYQHELDNLKTPNELKTQDQQNAEMNSLQSKIDELNSSLSSIQNSADTMSSAKK